MQVKEKSFEQFVKDYGVSVGSGAGRGEFDSNQLRSCIHFYVSKNTPENEVYIEFEYGNHIGVTEHIERLYERHAYDDVMDKFVIAGEVRTFSVSPDRKVTYPITLKIDK